MSPQWPPTDIPQQYRRAHGHSSGHRADVLASSLCGCFYCLAVYPPSEIVEWFDEPGDQGQTAICPKCGVDSVLGDKAGFPLTQEFLEEMQDRWFGP
jgi:hypothetical protein